jgi:hypothetical protein
LSERVQRDGIDTSAAVAFLQSAQQPQTVELSAVLGRDFPEWMTLWGASAARSRASIKDIMGRRNPSIRSRFPGTGMVPE